MKIKKYPQSHLLITNEDGKKLIIDPGNLTFEKGFKVNEFQGADLYLITHMHNDHMGWDTIKELVGDKPIFGNKDVTSKLEELGMEGKLVEDKVEFSVEGFKITPVDLPHFPHPLGNPMPQNTGFIINGTFFHAGDGYELTGFTIDNAALPIAHPSISTLQVLNFAKSLKVKLIIPIHYDAYIRDPNELAKLASQLNIEVRILNYGEETQI